MTAESAPAAEAEGIRADRLTRDQRKQLACARCGHRLFRDQYIGTIPDGRGGRLDLWACAPACAPP